MALPPAPLGLQLRYRSGAQANLIAAERAVKFANDKLQGRAANRPEDLIHTLQRTLRAEFGNSADATDRLTEEMSNPYGVKLRTDLIYQQRTSAIGTARARRYTQGRHLSAPDIWKDNIGNCFEHAVLACHYLKQSGIPSYIAETDDNTDHVFVLIGSPPGLDGQTVNVTSGAPGVISAPFAVVCDPWYHEWFSVQQDWGRKMWQIFERTTKNPPHPNPVPLKLISQIHIFP